MRVSLALACAASATPTAVSKHYTYWCIGSCRDDAKPSVSGGTILMGGGTDTDTAFKQHIKWSGGGDFLVIRATGDDSYNKYIQGLASTHSVATLMTNDKQAAEDPDVLDIIDRADAIFFAGGDQWTYLQEWQGTSMQKKIQAAVDRGVPVGGTSAGCDIQGGYIYTAENDSVESSEALQNPFDKHVTLQESPFLLHPSKLLTNVIVDTHFITRDRMGRLAAFVARLWKDGKKAFAIGIDEQTAIAIDASGKATMLQQGKDGGRAFVLMPTDGPEVCESGKDLEFSDITVQKLDAAYGDTFDFASFSGGVSSQKYKISASRGRLSPSDPYSPPDDSRASHVVV